MCLGVPGKVIEIYEIEGLKMGKIDFGGVVREACLAYVPEIEVGEYTVIHVGFAISQLSEEEAQATLEILNELADLQEEIGPEPQTASATDATIDPVSSRLPSLTTQTSAKGSADSTTVLIVSCSLYAGMMTIVLFILPFRLEPVSLPP